MALYGILAEFAEASSLLEAVHRVRARGYRRLEAYSPFSIEGLAEALGPTIDRVPFVTLMGGALGAVVGYFIQWYSATINYPINVGGRPLDSWPSFMPTTFEICVLAAAFGAVIGMLVQNGLPRLMHPLFAVEGFERATQDRFFLCVLSADPHFDAHATAEFLGTLGALTVKEVPE
jgi:hypothetical protein